MAKVLGHRRKRTKERKIRLRIEVKDFGPISHGNIDIKPLTLFIGPNNSGKSYAAMLIHSIFECCILPRYLRGMPFLRRRRFTVRPINLDSTFRQFPQIDKQIKSLNEGGELNFPDGLVQKVAMRTLDEIYRKRLSDEILGSFASPLIELIRIGRKSFTLKIISNSYETFLTHEKGKLSIKEYPKIDLKAKLRLIDSPRPTIEVQRKANNVVIEVGGIGEEKDSREFLRFNILDILSDVCASAVFENVGFPCHYLPAARSGILQGHKALSAFIVKRAPYFGIEALEIPKFSGVVSDFLSSVIALPEEKGPFYGLAQDFEKELIEGEIVLRTLEEHPYPEIKYYFQNTEIPLHRSSSTVSEMAPLFLYLKYNIEPGSILIIEEPEAHLHPRNQRILARYLVKLVREGVNVTITTHSEYLIEQLNSFLLLSKVDKKSRVDRYKYDVEDFLKPNEIGVYVFGHDDKRGGHKINEVEITEEDGISEEEFVKIHEALYEEKIRLLRELSKHA